MKTEQKPPRWNIFKGNRTSKSLLTGLCIAGGVALAAAALPSWAEAAPAEMKKPNIVFIMGDDIGMWNIGAYHRGMMAGKTPPSINLPRKACCLPTITPRRVARLVAPTSSPVSCPSAPA